MTKIIRTVSLFSGVGMTERGIERACKQLKLPHPEIVAYCENNRVASECFNALHGTTSEYHNLKNVLTPDGTVLAKCTDIDILTSTFPCQSFSSMGLKKGFEDVEKGGMLKASLLLIHTIRPKIVFFENVPPVKKYGAEELINRSLGSIYYCCYQILNSCFYGHPQSRVRWFGVCIRKDLIDDNTPSFLFPKPSRYPCIDITRFLDFSVPLEIRQANFSEKFLHLFSKEGISSMWKKEEELTFSLRNNGLIKVADPVGQGFWKTGMIKESSVYSIYGSCPTLTTCCYNTLFAEIGGRLTEGEAWALMGMRVSDYKLLTRIGLITSKTQAYKIAGNGVVVETVSRIMKQIIQFL